MQTVPTLDLSQFVRGSSMDKMAFAKELVEALRQFGFVRLRNHGISTWTIHTASSYSRKLFELPRKALDLYYVPSARGQVGYMPPGTETAVGHTEADLKVSWSVSREADPKNPRHEPYRKMPNVWPEKELPGFRGAALDLYKENERCAVVIAEALELGLDLPKKTLTSLLEDGDSLLRFLYYFTIAGSLSDGAMRSAPHRDSNLFTFLRAASADGLSIQDGDGFWMPVERREGEIVMNVGDMLERFTNGFLRSTPHCVLNPTDASSDRETDAFFVHGHPDAVLHVPDRFRGEGFPKAPDDITCGVFLQSILQQTIRIKAA